VFFNVRTLQQVGSEELLARTLNERDVILAGLVETRVPGDVIHVTDTPGPGRPYHPSYRLYLSGPTDGSGQRGVGFAISSLWASLIDDWQPISDRIALIRLNTSPLPTVAVCAYAPTNDADDRQKDDFYELLNRTILGFRKDTFLLLLGDFNATLGKPIPEEVLIGPHSLGERNDNGDRFYAFLEHHNLVAVNTFFRHKRRHLVTWLSPDGRTRKQLDFICIKRRFKGSALSCRSYWGSSLLSDHALLVARLRLRLKKSRPTQTPKVAVERLAHAPNRQAFQTSLLNNLAAHLPLSQSVDAKWDRIRNCVMNSANASLGTRKKPVDSWITPHTLDLVDARKSATGANRRVLTAGIKEQLKRDKDEYWQKRAFQMNNAVRRGKTGKLFRILKQASGKRIPGACLVSDKDGNPLTGTEERMGRWRQHFQEVLNKPSPNCPPIENDYHGQLDVDDRPPTEEEVAAAITSMRSSGAPGEDDISAALLKAGFAELKQPLTELCTQIWQSELLPERWKTSIIVPIYKKGSKTSCANYRPISLIDIGYKMVEAIVSRRIRSALDNSLRENQGGFRPGRSTVDQIFALRQILELRNEFQQPTCVAFVDFKAAFDSIDRSRMYRVLSDLGLPDKIIGLMRQMYSRCTSVVRVGKDLSQPFTVESGVKQGALLSPDMFNTVLDSSLTNALDEADGVRLDDDSPLTDLDYADDIALIAESPHQLQAQLERLASSAASMGLKINAEKTKVLFDARTPNAPILLDGQALEEVDSFCYLGSHICSNGSSTTEIRSRIAKAQAAFSNLNTVLWRDRDVELATKLKVYLAAIRPILLYACETWIQKADDLRRLQSFEFRCWRFILGVTFRDRATNRSIVDSISPPNLCREVVLHRRLAYLGHVLRRPNSFPARRCLLAEPQPHWKRPPGRPPLTWQRTLLNDLKPLQLSHLYRNFGKDWKRILTDIARDREQYKQMTQRAAALCPE
jgi:hypothetical protein